LADIGADHYVDKDADGLPDWIEKYKDPNALSLTPEGDEDGDGRTNLEEYEIDRTHPCIAAAMYYINPQSGQDDRDGLSWDTALETLEEGLLRAQNEDRIVLAAGVYADTVRLTENSLTIQSRDPQDPNAVADTMLTGSIVCSAEGGGQGCRLEGLSIVATDMPAFTCSGAARCTLWKCRLRDMSYDGDINIESALLNVTNGEVIFNDCELVQNDLPPLGLLMVQGGSATFQHCLIAGNYGGVYAQVFIVVEGGKLVLENSTVTENRALRNIPPEMIALITAQGITLSQPTVLGVMGGEFQARNSILWNEPGKPEVDIWIEEGLEGTLAMTLEYSTMSVIPDTTVLAWQGEGVLDQDPLFVRSGLWNIGNGDWIWQAGDYHL
ncbi:MAG: hypothetical protein MI922_24150, partial [Bacteroidales bacterium]|nr:hypothetical protein [Bacteroidales bacterium]